MPAMPSQNTNTDIKTYEEALQFLDSLDVSAMKLGLSRIQRLLETLGDPQDYLPMVHIAGTNGKGSVTAMLSSVLKTSGLQVGSFISPHLVHVRERISINGNPILPDDFQYEVSALKQHLEALCWPREDWPTYFEMLNIMAYQYFRRKGVDVTVFETGLGGRLDSTNVVRQPNLTVITTIGLDHMQHLGDTIEAIAREKAGILKPGVPLVIGSQIPPSAQAVIQEVATALDVPLHHANSASLEIDRASSSAEKGLSVRMDGVEHPYQLSLLAPYQKDNLAIVLACVQQLRLQGFDIQEVSLREGLRQTHWPVRFQYFKEAQLLLDGSHNDDGFQALETGLRMYFADRPLIWVLSLRNNRSPERLLSLLKAFPMPLAVVVTQAKPIHLYHPPVELAGHISEALSSANAFSLESSLSPLSPVCPVVVTKNPVAALAQLRFFQEAFWAQRPLALVTGSLYTAGAILEQLEKPVGKAEISL